MDDNSLHNYEINKNENYDKTPIVETNAKLKAFHSGIGDGNDCLISKPVISTASKFYNILVSIVGVNYVTKSYYSEIGVAYRIKATATDWMGEPVEYIVPDTMNDPLYGYVNGSGNASDGKQNLRFKAPKIEFPTSVTGMSLDVTNITYHIILEGGNIKYSNLNINFDNQSSAGVGTLNEDMVTMSYDIIENITSKNSTSIPVVIYGPYTKANLKPLNYTITINKPSGTYSNYELSITSDNPFISVDTYNKAIVFTGTTLAIPFVINNVPDILTKWNPQIHNGYYYINQNEYCIYSKFNNEYVTFVNNKVTVSPMPQQFLPIIVVDDIVGILEQVHFTDENDNSTLTNTDKFISKGQKFFRLTNDNIDITSIKIYINDVLDLNYDLHSGVVNNMLEMTSIIAEGVNVKVLYKVNNSYMVVYDVVNDSVVITKNTKQTLTKTKIIFETNKLSNKIDLEHLSLNPIYNIDNKGFIYITDELFDPKKIDIYANPTIIDANGEDNVNMYISVSDLNGNPVTGETIKLSTSFGKISADTFVTDINGVIACNYKSTLYPCIDKVVAECSSVVLTKTIKIINK